MKKMFLAAALLAVVSLANAQAPANAPYGVKSGVITMSMDMMGNEMITETYFDDYGLKTAQVSEGGFMGGEGKTRTITDKDGAQIRINDAEKTATKFPAGGMGMGFGGGNRAQINWNNLTDQVKKENNIKEVGKETIAGKECTKYTMTVDMMGNQSEQTVWIYKGIQLKNEMTSDFGTFGQTCKKFEEKAVDASMFEVPAGVKVEEFDMSQFGGFGGF
jgi:superoxide dismutase